MEKLARERVSHGDSEYQIEQNISESLTGWLDHAPRTPRLHMCRGDRDNGEIGLKIRP